MKFSDFFLAITFFILSAILLCLPGSTIPKSSFLTAIHADKWVHIGMFGLLCVLFCRPLRKADFTGGKRRWIFALIALAATAYGIGMEFVQDRWVSNRSFEVTDIMADAAGTALGWIISVNRWGRGKKLVPIEIGTATKTNCL